MVDKKQSKALKELGSKFRQSRESIGLTQAEVAKAANVHVNFYARVERGEENPSFEKLQSIMKVLKIKTLNIF